MSCESPGAKKAWVIANTTKFTVPQVPNCEFVMLDKSKLYDSSEVSLLLDKVKSETPAIVLISLLRAGRKCDEKAYAHTLQHSQGSSFPEALKCSLSLKPCQQAGRIKNCSKSQQA